MYRGMEEGAATAFSGYSCSTWASLIFHYCKEVERRVLRLNGVDTSCFLGHSTRSASTSAAALSGMTTAGIMQRAGWSQTNTFARFYHKPTDGESNAAQFSSAILTDKGYKHAYNVHVDRPESSEI